jgi:hypothetical protein
MRVRFALAAAKPRGRFLAEAACIDGRLQRTSDRELAVRIVLVGSIGRFPVAGHAWINLQYLLGFRALGCDVYYLEDCGDESWVYDWRRQSMSNDLDLPARFVAQVLNPVGFDGRWIYRAGDASAGMSVDALREVCAAADLLLIRGAPIPEWRPEYQLPRRRAFLDVDPMFTQVKAAQGNREMLETLGRCETLVTVAQRVGRQGCTVPTLDRVWRATVSPVFLPAWPMAKATAPRRFTTIMQWSSYRRVEFDGASYGNKKHEFPKFTEVARRAQGEFTIAMTGRPPARVDTRGWRIIDGVEVSSTLEDYQRFIQQSSAEFAVAKHGYVASRGGWFSDRSVCYLASGKPVIVQDTGLEDWLPVGRGVLTFRTVDEAVAAVEDVQTNYEEHCLAAREIAEQFFATERVLPELLDRVTA